MDKLRRTIPGSITSAVAAVLMIGALAFGTTVIRPMSLHHEAEATTAQADDGTTAGHDGGATEPDGNMPDGDGTAFVPGSEVAGSDGEASNDGASEDLPDPKDYTPPADEPKDEPPAEEPPAPPKEEPAPSTHLNLVAAFNADKGYLVVEWSAYTGSFEKYKLVRSTDEAATWPLGEGDELVAVVGPDGARRFVDGNADCGTEYHYRVFAVKHGEEGYVVLASSNVDGAMRTCEEPQPPAEPMAMGFELAQTDGGVHLSWEQCSSEQFAVYKVVRSATNESPMYPLNDGSELIGVIDNHEVTSFTDSNVEAGQTWHYRVLCMGQNGDGWYVLGLTDAKTLTVE